MTRPLSPRRDPVRESWLMVAGRGVAAFNRIHTHGRLGMSRYVTMSYCRGDGRCAICDPPTRHDPDEIEETE